MALVIFCVALTEAMRLRRSFSEGMGGRSRSCEILREAVDVTLQGCPKLVGNRLLPADRVENLLALRAHVGEQPALEPPDVHECKPVEIAVDAGEDDDDLLLGLQRRELRLLQELGQ